MQNDLLQLQEQMGQDEQAAAGKLQPQDYLKFVQFFRHASPYIAGHRGRTFVIVVPGSVSEGVPAPVLCFEDLSAARAVISRRSHAHT